MMATIDQDARVFVACRAADMLLDAPPRPG
jgi:hypothetical protein